MSEQLFQIGIKAIIRDSGGRILLVSVPYADVDEFWDLPGGRMDAGEDFMQALARELQEEIGVQFAGTPRLIMPMLSKFKISDGDQPISLAMLAYEVQLVPNAEPKAIEKGSNIRWFAPQEAAKLLAAKFPPEFCDYIAKL